VQRKKEQVRNYLSEGQQVTGREAVTRGEELLLPSYPHQIALALIIFLTLAQAC
jgi:hypothetical protein